MGCGARRMRLSVVTPLYKSAPYIEELYRRLRCAALKLTSDYEIVFVNDGSPDDGIDIARRIADTDGRVRVIDLSRNFGQHPATLTGLRHATGDYIYVCDSDLEDEPEWLNLFYDHLRRNDADVVYGVMTNKNGGWAYRLLRNLFYGLLRTVSGINFPTNVVPARVMSRRYLNALLSYPEHEVFLLGLWHAPGFKQLAYGVAKLDRSPSTYTFGKLASLFVNGIISFSIRPLAAVAVIGLVISFLAFGLTALLVIRSLAFGQTVPGWASIITAMLFVGGLTISLNGVIALYIAKIFLEVKRRPVTIVREVYRRSQPLRYEAISAGESNTAAADNASLATLRAPAGRSAG